MSEDPQSVNAEDLLKLLLERMREHAMILINTEGNIIGWLAAAERLFGYLPNEIIGQHVSILYTPENRAAGMVEYEQDVARTDNEAEDDRWMLRKDGGRFWATGVLTPLRNSAGELAGFGKILRDRTDIRAELQTLVKQNESLKHAEQRKNKFISTLSHELRNPLGSLSLSLELLKLAENDPKLITDTAETMANEVVTMRRMVDDLIDVTRLSTGKVALELQCQDL